MHLVGCTHERHARAILDIFNDAIAHTTALYDYHPRPLASMAPWFDAKTRGGFPVLGMEDEQGTLMGFATYGPFRERPAYKYTVEHSVYVAPACRRQGVGRRLLEAVIAAATSQDLHLLVGGIDGENHASIALHEALGFAHAGTIRQAGFKFGRWLDLAFYQLVLETPKAPRDG